MSNTWYLKFSILCIIVWIIGYFLPEADLDDYSFWMCAISAAKYIMILFSSCYLATIILIFIWKILTLVFGEDE